MSSAVRSISPPPHTADDPPWASYVIRAHLPRMTEAEVLETIEDGRMARLLGGNCSFVLFPQRKAHRGGPEIKPVSYHNSSGIPIVDGHPVNDYGTWIPLGPSAFVNNQGAGQWWSLPLDGVQEMKLRSGKATIVCPDSRYALHN